MMYWYIFVNFLRFFTILICADRHLESLSIALLTTENGQVVVEKREGGGGLQGSFNVSL